MKIDRHTTWMILRRGDEVLFGTKLHGFGEGKLVSAGGKVEDGESYEAAAIRETAEELGVKVSQPTAAGELIFENIYYKGEYETDCMHIYIADQWEGDPRESDEIGDLQWVKAKEIDYTRLWEDDQYWLPYILIGEQVQGVFRFEGEETKLVERWVETVPSLVIDELDDSAFDLPVIADESDFRMRYAARAVLIDDEGRIGLEHATKRGYYKLPGGGIDKDELIHEALVREVIEEAGYEIEVLDTLGKTIEHRSAFKQINTSYAYLCRAVHYVGNQLMDDEIEEGFELEWFDDIDAAIAAVEGVDQTKLIYQGLFFTARELAILRAARPVIKAMLNG